MNDWPFKRVNQPVMARPLAEEGDDRLIKEIIYIDLMENKIRSTEKWPFKKVTAE